ncbi:MAG: T9SS type A sorting domain-containing protein [Cyanothece sp. SIO1E1]|nr:T9SS type A sorting domain-containing protein [Cyanothece sp. SIO1E1]
MESSRFQLLLLCSFLPMVLTGQRWLSEQAVWHFHLSGFIAYTGYQKIQCDRDTIILGEQAKVLGLEEEVMNQLDPSLQVSQNYWEVIVKEHGDTLSMWMEDRFYPIYNFSLEVGDQYEVPSVDFAGIPCSENEFTQITILELGEMELSGQTFRYQRWETASLYSYEPRRWLVVEGIGLLNSEDLPGQTGGFAYLLYPLNGNFLCIIDAPSFHFRCYSSENFSYQVVDIPCDFIVLNTQEQDLLNQVELYPNPTAGVVYLSNLMEVDIQEVNILNPQGQVVQRHPTPGISEFSLADLPAGLYLLQIRFSNLQLDHARILKH